MKLYQIAALAAPAQAALRFGCSTLSIQRLDPLVEPGKLPSAHVHQIVGGNAFNATMDTDPSKLASCTTCTFSEDFSNYWTAAMYFKHTNGSYKRVSIMENAALPNGINGGMTGFRMTVGSPTTNTVEDAKKHPGLRFVCLTDKNTRFPESPTFPTTPCKGGIMTVHHFPSCWDGKNVDSPNHQDHMYNTAKEAFAVAGPCPASHPVRMPQVAYETLWDTTQFKDMWPTDGNNPFFLSYKDNKGYGTHADYLFGWKGDALQKAMDDKCMFQACENGRPLKSQNVQAMNKCTVKPSVQENIDGWLDRLPGMAM
ncbi:conserved hypothetical protein [Pyrenophora tritici-repentis Pt-1C-BFP]|uniref:DUF1996 domain-containing protein n=1 Tax=Pyrenophora tritici-repentis (strain Pt-1C-BFP) TaxID=426418 RepID=B2WAF9_PYRTR|nr:uncharacterized protein PTRG_07272 [Pyrenophora tritici-repentis Pt-1C-BFP]EDU50191.1 conserved hypothetical protein [Pyrenophora tritici-repentis Pt-1C-BFP]